MWYFILHETRVFSIAILRICSNSNCLHTNGIIFVNNNVAFQPEESICSILWPILIWVCLGNRCFVMTAWKKSRREDIYILLVRTSLEKQLCVTLSRLLLVLSFKRNADKLLIYFFPFYLAPVGVLYVPMLVFSGNRMTAAVMFLPTVTENLHHRK